MDGSVSSGKTGCSNNQLAATIKKIRTEVAKQGNRVKGDKRLRYKEFAK